ncbi:conserved hypothetical protein [Pediculus humanus corporis]|uniref:Bromo domain-containing protein n=1 Tax=Pediculus humanus subsp. corporis TaxID=121224 RepID=E0W0C2_PEDHC|nr:uncharacterized protein Phum_PHUM549580 [Pediculus humanus corporis]EEB19078.1 conserved hypothetical protein [Pediculus humanus corporis]
MVVLLSVNSKQGRPWLKNRDHENFHKIEMNIWLPCSNIRKISKSITKSIKEHQRASNNLAKVARLNKAVLNYHANVEKEQKKEQERIEKERMRRLMVEEEGYSDGRILSEPFIKLPSKNKLPDYYDIIKKPLDIKKIFNRIEDGKYSDFDDLEKDFTQMCKNAQIYNEEASLIHEDSIVLQSVFTNARQRLEQDAETDEDKGDDERIPSTEMTSSFAGGREDKREKNELG